MLARTVLVLAFAFIAGCGGGGGDGTPPVPSRFLYASAYAGPNTFPGAIYGFAVYPNGALSPVPGPPAPTANGGGPIAITRDSKLLYTTMAPFAAMSGELLPILIHADGSLTNASGASFSMPDRPEGLVANPIADFLYASWHSGVLTVSAIDPTTGALSLTSSVTLGNEFIKTPAVITPDGRYLYQNDAFPEVFPTSMQIAGFSANAMTGALSPVPASPLSPTTPAESSPGLMAIDPSGRFLYAGYQFFVVNVGEDGGLVAYSLDVVSGELTAVPGSPFSVGGVPNSVAIDASGRYVIVSISPRLGGPEGNCLAVLSIDPGTGALTPVRGSPFGPMHSCGAVAADPSGPYVYAGTALGPANTPATVFVFSIDQATGALDPIGKTTIPGKLGVSFIALTH
jgi:DNA-binding beta-propeller fold protein YncE